MEISKIEREIELINKQLSDEFGLDIVTGKPIFRIVWNTDQMEKVYGTFTDYTEGGIFIREVTETRIVHKYRGFKLDRYVLERLVQVPPHQQDQLLGLKISYEGLWTFSDAKGNYLPPTWLAAKFVIDCVLAAQSVMKKMIDPSDKSDYSLNKYKHNDDPEYNQEASIEFQKQRANQIENELFGDESGLGGSTLPGGNAIIVPANYERNKL